MLAQAIAAQTGNQESPSSGRNNDSKFSTRQHGLTLHHVDVINRNISAVAEINHQNGQDR
jgi:hypothetical protein